MKRSYEAVTLDLDAKLPECAISTREAGNGQRLSYVTGWYVIDRLNKVVGIGNWAYESTVSFLHEGSYNSKFYTCYSARVKLVVAIGDDRTEFTDYGFGDGIDAKNPGKTHELAIKESITDGLKRCAKNLGMSMGLALYDKEQANVEEAPQPQRGDVSDFKRATPPVTGNPKTVSKPVQGVPRASTHSNAPAAAASTESVTQRLVKAKFWEAKKDNLITLPDFQSYIATFGVTLVAQLTPEQADATLVYLNHLIENKGA